MVATSVVIALLAVGMLVTRQDKAKADVAVVRSAFQGRDGRSYTVTNHLVRTRATSAALTSGTGTGHEYLLVWAGDKNVADTTGADIQRTPLQVNPVKLLNEDAVDDPPAPDFLAVIDADRASPDYGKVVNTATVGPLVENEPHHMQYLYHKGDKIYAGGLFSDTTYVFDVSKLPALTISGVNGPLDTPCGSIPDAYWTLPDHTAYGTYMGGPDVPGPCQYSDGSVRVGNGFGGSPGEIVHLGPDGKTLSEMPAATASAEDPNNCPNYPAIVNTCANPHGIQARSDLHTLIASDYAEPRNIVLDPVKPEDAKLFRDTVRTFDITDENRPKLKSVSVMPDGPRKERNPGHEEPRGMMEATVTNLPQHKGAFAESMCGGVIYYTPDITSQSPTWREVFDDTEASKAADPNFRPIEGAGCDGGGWLQTDPTDHYLYHAVIGRNPGSLEAADPGVPKMVYALDIAKLVAAGTSTQCAITTIDQVWGDHLAADCPTVASVQPIADGTSGGPHWGAIDNFVKDPSGGYTETTKVARLAVSNYFVARTGVNGNHQVCMVDVSPTGKLSMDTTFRDENEGTPCVDFNRTDWPHGRNGDAKPHSELFVVPDDSLH